MKKNSRFDAVVLKKPFYDWKEIEDVGIYEKGRWVVRIRWTCRNPACQPIGSLPYHHKYHLKPNESLSTNLRPTSTSVD